MLGKFNERGNRTTHKTIISPSAGTNRMLNVGNMFDIIAERDAL